MWYYNYCCIDKILINMIIYHAKVQMFWVHSSVMVRGRTLPEADRTCAVGVWSAVCLWKDSCHGQCIVASTLICCHLKDYGTFSRLCLGSEGCRIFTSQSLPVLNMLNTHMWWSTNHISLKKGRPRCYAKSSTVQDMFQLIPALISCARVTAYSAQWVTT